MYQLLNILLGLQLEIRFRAETRILDDVRWSHRGLTLHDKDIQRRRYDLIKYMMG